MLNGGVLMSAVMLRRRGLGRGSCNGIANVSTTNIKVVRNWQDSFPSDLSLVFRWGCTSSIPGDPLGVVVNTAKAIHWCSDKRQSRMDMQQAGVPVPRTFTSEEFLSREFEAEEYVPYVLRRARHAQGRDLWHGGISTIREAIVANAVQGGYVSEFIGKVAEYRVMVVQNRVAWVAKKTPGNPEDVAWNVAQGGRFDNVRWSEWPMRVIVAAIHAAKVGKLDFGGIDVMVDAEGNPYVLEVNSAPSQTSPYRQQCLAKAFDYIVTNGKEHLPDHRGAGWKYYIHPAVRSSSRE